MTFSNRLQPEERGGRIFKPEERAGTSTGFDESSGKASMCIPFSNFQLHGCRCFWQAFRSLAGTDCRPDGSGHAGAHWVPTDTPESFPCNEFEDEHLHGHKQQVFASTATDLIG